MRVCRNVVAAKARWKAFRACRHVSGLTWTGPGEMRRRFDLEESFEPASR